MCLSSVKCGEGPIIPDPAPGAKALLKQPRLLVLDEATSALDELSQARVPNQVSHAARYDLAQLPPPQTGKAAGRP